MLSFTLIKQTSKNIAHTTCKQYVELQFQIISKKLIYNFNVCIKNSDEGFNIYVYVVNVQFVKEGSKGTNDSIEEMIEINLTVSKTLAWY